MIVSFTIRLVVTLEEVARAQRLFTVNADEMLGMPEVRQCRNHLHSIITVTISANQLALIIQCQQHTSSQNNV